MKQSTLVNNKASNQQKNDSCAQHKCYLPRILRERMQTVDLCQRARATRQFCREICRLFVVYQQTTTARKALTTDNYCYYYYKCTGLPLSLRQCRGKLCSQNAKCVRESNITMTQHRAVSTQLLSKLNMTDCSMPMNQQIGMQRVSAITMNVFATTCYGY